MILKNPKPLLPVILLTAVVGLLYGSLSPADAQVTSRNRPLIIAHRGGARETTENTIEGFQRAGKIGADGIETDIRLTRDGVVVIYHDDIFGRVEGLPKPQQTRLVAD